MNIAPPPEILNALKNQSLDWKTALGELVDNAFDAGASTVVIDFDGKNLIVSDDGEGCSDIAAMLTLGRHVKQRGTRLGRYGVGLKDAALWLGGSTNITTHRHGKSVTATVDWSALEKSRSWELPDPLVMQSKPGERGTRIVFQSHTRSVPDGIENDRLAEALGYIFAPAIKNGKRIIIQPKTRRRSPIECPRFVFPDLLDVVDTHITVNGKGARLHVGIVPEGVPNPRPGITYSHAFRVIMPSSGLGCGGEFSYARVAGWCDLDDSWVLKKNKDGISAHIDDLGEAVYAACRHVIEKAAGQAWVIQSNLLARSLTSRLQQFLAEQSDVKAKRNKGNKQGTAEPKNTGKNHQRARNLQPGEKVMKALRASELRIDFVPLGDSTIGDVDALGNTVRLSSDHPTVSAMFKEGDQRGLIFVIAGLLANHDIIGGDGQLILSLRDTSMSSKYGPMVAQVVTGLVAPRLGVVAGAEAAA